MAKTIFPDGGGMEFGWHGSTTLCCQHAVPAITTRIGMLPNVTTMNHSSSASSS